MVAARRDNITATQAESTAVTVFVPASTQKIGSQVVITSSR